MISQKLTLIFVFAVFFFSASAQSTIKWMTFQQAVEANKKTPRKFLIDISTVWCGWCKKMDATTFTNPVLAKYINEHYYPVKLDGEYKKDIEFQGRVYKFVPNGARGYHELPAELMGGKMTYPTIVYLTPDYKIIQAIAGYKSPQELEPIIKFFGDDVYAQEPWNTYLASFQSDLGGGN